jgi:UDP-sugar diphosphatase
LLQIQEFSRNGVGTTGALQTMYFAEVTDSMRVSKGGGLVEEGEMIDVVDIPVSEAMKFVMDDIFSATRNYRLSLILFSYGAMNSLGNV